MIAADVRAVGAAVVVGISSLCLGQASYWQGFDNVGPVAAGQDGPSGLIGAGWIFRNQSNARVSTVWRQGSEAVDSIGANSGSGYLASNADWDAGNRNISTWAILPPIPNIRAGDVISFFITGWAYNDNRIQLRYSPSGGTGTGSSYTDVGDFTTVITDVGVVPVTFAGWQHVTATAPGTGRLAVRWFNPQVMTTQSPLVAIDTLTITATAIDPPIPGPGQTVTWRLADSPIQIRSNTTIPAGATVNVEPGVTIAVGQSATLTVLGTLHAVGTGAQRITVTAPLVFPPAITLDGAGTVELGFADIRGQIRPGGGTGGGNLIVTDSTFAGPNGVIYGDMYGAAGFARLERDTFTNSEFTLTGYTARLRDLTLTGSITRLTRCYGFISNIVSDGQPVWYFVERVGQPTAVDSVTVRNVAGGAGLALYGGDFFVGPGVTLQNNGYPVSLDSAGLLPGSALPVSGNTRNMVLVPGGDHGAVTTWANAGIPYFLQAAYSQHGGGLEIRPGVTVRMDTNAGMASDPSPIRAMGTPEAPITFEPAVAGAPWYPLQLFYRIRHTVLDGARIAGAWPSIYGWGFVDSSVVRNSTITGFTGQVQVHKTLFQNNAAAANILFVDDLLGQTNPNLFEGNAGGVQGASDARYNWWGSPTGPRAADNPVGTGDPVAAGVPYQPFLTARPDMNDAPPVVDFKKHSFMARPGQKMILTWDARDDGTIVSQRVLMSVDGDIIQQNLTEPVITLADNLPGTQRTIVFTAPAPSSRFFGSGNIRIEATDNAGQVGWDDIHLYLEANEAAQLTLTSPLATAWTSGQNMGQVCWSGPGLADAYLLLENSGRYISLGGSNTGCLALNQLAPFSSTDRARFVLSLFTGGGVSQPEFFYSAPFTVRPDVRVGDAAPAVAVTAPGAGQAIGGGSVAGIAWLASDDEFVRSISIQQSTDNGRTWSFLAQDLPGTQSSFAWQTPPVTGGTPVLLKVIAVDHRFQDTSAIVAVTLTASRTCDADFNCDGDTGTDADIESFFACLAGSCPGGPCQSTADFNGDGDFGTDADIEAFFRVLAGGSC